MAILGKRGRNIIVTRREATRLFGVKANTLTKFEEQAGIKPASNRTGYSPQELKKLETLVARIAGNMDPSKQP